MANPHHYDETGRREGLPHPAKLGKEDYDQATWLARVLEGRIRYDYSTKAWHVWTGVRWKRDQDGEVVRMVEKAVVDRILVISEDDKLSDKDMGEAVKTASRLKDQRYFNSAMFMLAAMPGYGTDGSDWDQDENLLGCENGIVDLRLNALVEATPEMKVTKTTGWNFKPIAGPEEFADRAPLFMKFLQEVTSGDTQLAMFYVLWFGSSMFGFTPEQRFLILTGVGRNGKGALAHAMNAVFGEYAAAAADTLYMKPKWGVAKSNEARADLVALKGKRVAIMSEPEGGEFNDELLKAHTGGDRIVARALNSNVMLEWLPTHSITFLTNEPPKVHDLGPSMAARVMVADFQERYEGPKEDKQLYEKLRSEKAAIGAILCWAAAAWWRSFSTGGPGLTMPKRVIEASRRYMEESDPLSEAMKEAFVIAQGVQASGRALYDAYTDWHADSGRKDTPISMTKFGLALEERGFRKKHTVHGAVWSGIRPLSAMEMADGDDAAA